MKRAIITPLIIGTLAMLLSACGAATGSLTSDAADPSASDNAAALVGKLFSGSSANLARLKVVSLPETCDIASGGSGPTGVTLSPTAAPAVYGSANSSIAVTALDTCVQADGTSNNGNGPDGNGLVAGFELVGEVLGSCQGDGAPIAVTMKPSSFGVWRNTTAEQTGEAYSPQIWGSFLFEVDGEELSLDCTIYLSAENEDEVAYADCTDADGNTVVQENDPQCEFGAE